MAGLKGLDSLLCIVVNIWVAIDDDRSLPLVDQSIDRLHSVDFKWVSNQKSLELKRLVNREGGPSLHNQVSCSEQSYRGEMRWLLSKCGFSTRWHDLRMGTNLSFQHFLSLLRTLHRPPWSRCVDCFALLSGISSFIP
jgi:hypothetical protein